MRVDVGGVVFQCFPETLDGLLLVAAVEMNDAHDIMHTSGSGVFLCGFAGPMLGVGVALIVGIHQCQSSHGIGAHGMFVVSRQFNGFLGGLFGGSPLVGFSSAGGQMGHRQCAAVGLHKPACCIGVAFMSFQQQSQPQPCHSIGVGSLAVVLFCQVTEPFLFCVEPLGQTALSDDTQG